eukprot:scaffold86650_cov59-Phaeocystis_antarctica.AAC.7
MYTAETQAELDTAYAEWSTTYDDDSLRRFGYAAPAEAASLALALALALALTLALTLALNLALTLALALTSRHLGPELDARILDAGAGTGLVGSFLAAKGYRNLVGLDRSQPMLEQADPTLTPTPTQP